MNNQKKTQKTAIRLAIIYTFMAFAVVSLVTILVYVMLGYRFDRTQGKIEQGGLVQFATKPSGSKVTVDGHEQGFNTPNKATLNTGKHTVEMNRDGYINWKKDVEVNASSVLWLNYARLIPKDIKKTNVGSFAGVASSLASDNQKTFALIEDAAKPEISLANIDSDKPTINKIAIPLDDLTAHNEGAPNNYQLVKWDNSNRYLLVKHTYNEDNAVEWIVVDTEDVKSSKNLTTLLGVNMSGVEFALDHHDIFYAISDGALRKINSTDATISRPLVNHVAKFTQYDKATITYVTAKDEATGKRHIGYYTDGSQKPIVIRSYADDGNAALEFKIGKYFNDRYMAIFYNQTLEIIKGDLPSSDTNEKLALKPVATVVIPEGFNEMEFGPNQRFIVVRSGAHLTTYDLELNQTHTVALEGYSNQTTELKWLDGYNLITDYDSKLRMFEFDGLNPRLLMPVVEGQAVSLSPSGKYLYAITKTEDGKFYLTQALLVL